MLAALIVLGALAIGGFVGASATTRDSTFGMSVALVGVAALAYVAMGALIAVGRLPVPAWSWARTPIGKRWRPQGFAVALLGAVAIGWDLLAAAGAGYRWGTIGLEALLLLSIVAVPLARRWPRREWMGPEAGLTRRSAAHLTSASADSADGALPPEDASDAEPPQR